MKNMRLIFAGLVVAAGITSCSNSGSGTSGSDSAKQGDSNTAGGNNMTSGNPESMSSSSNTSSNSKLPLTKDDSTFVIKAATGGLMEVNAGTLAQSNAGSDRVKMYGQMMVNDHTKANSELSTIASGRGIALPTDLPADMKEHTDAMSKMKGKSFDSHYISMMLADHKKTIDLFEKEASSGSDAELKAFATKTLPVLKLHLDSTQAISKMKM